MSIRYIIFSICLLFSGCNALNLDVNQKDLYSEIVELAKPYGLEKQVLAITYKESSFGKFVINLKDPSCGITHININTFMRRHNIKNTEFNRNVACSQLIMNTELAIANAVEELLFWKTKYCKKNGKCTKEQWRSVYASYNCGYRNKSKKCIKYALEIESFIEGIK